MHFNEDKIPDAMKLMFFASSRNRSIILSVMPMQVILSITLEADASELRLFIADDGKGY